MNIIVDINNAFHKSFFVYKNIYKEEKINEKLLFNKFITDFMYSCRLFADKHSVEKIICCYDSESSFRKLFYPQYKSNRVKKDDSFYNVMNYSMKYFSDLGFIVTQIKDLEADDCVGLWIDALKNQINYILSADEDVRQLLNEKTIIYNNNSKDKRFYHYTKHDELKFIPFPGSKVIFENPNWILFKKMILGCDGDMVPKLLKGRIGESTLQKKIFEKIQFNKDYVEDSDIVAICSKLNDVFKEQVLIKDLDINYQLVNLCSHLHLPDVAREFWSDHLSKSKFTYNGNYQVDI